MMDHLQGYLLFKKIKGSQKAEPIPELKQIKSQRNIDDKETDNASDVMPVIFTCKHPATSTKKKSRSSIHQPSCDDQ